MDNNRPVGRLTSGLGEPGGHVGTPESAPLQPGALLCSVLASSLGGVPSHGGGGRGPSSSRLTVSHLFNALIPSGCKLSWCQADAELGLARPEPSRP